MGCSCLKPNVIIKSNIRPSNNSINDINELNNLLNNSNNNINNSHSNERNRNQRENNITNNNNENNNNIQSNNNHNHYNNFFFHQNNYEPYLQSKNDPSFNFPEIENEYVGKGIKKMKGYISKISLSQLNKLREDFWSSRIEGNNEIWELLHVICSDNSLNEEEIENIMKDGGIIPYKNCINITYDSKGALYEIPNYCINEPFKYEIDDIKKNKPKEEDIVIVVRFFINQDKIKISNYKLVLDLKYEIKKLNKYKDENIKNFRIFFGGKELCDDKELWSYNFINESICQLLLKKEDKKNKEIKEKNNDIYSEIMSEKPNNDEIVNSNTKNLEETFHKVIENL